MTTSASREARSYRASRRSSERVSEIDSYVRFGGCPPGGASLRAVGWPPGGAREDELWPQLGIAVASAAASGRRSLCARAFACM